tara:strand:- start:580 stop:906 length:327 start_codon:yes stop_codon:yes gene_type:complete
MSINFSNEQLPRSVEQKYSTNLRDSIFKYWHSRGYDIDIWVDDSPEIKLYPQSAAEKKSRKRNICVYPLRSNIGPHGYPPKMTKVQRDRRRDWGTVSGVAEQIEEDQE